MSFSIWLFLGAIALFCIGYTLGGAAAQGLRETIAREIARTVIDINDKEQKQAGKLNKTANREQQPS